MKLGQPVPDSNFVDEENSSAPHPAQRYDAVALLVNVAAGERPLGSLLAQHVVLLRRQLLAPLGLGLLDDAGGASLVLGVDVLVHALFDPGRPHERFSQSVGGSFNRPRTDAAI